MNKQNNQRATYGDSTMMEHTLYHVQLFKASMSHCREDMYLFCVHFARMHGHFW